MSESMGDRARILIIDDDEVILATTEALLVAFGYEVSTHAGAFGASAAIKAIRPDLILLDVNMPGLSGPSLAALVQREEWSKDVRIFFFSSSDEAVLQASVDETGADGFICKGDRTELQQKLKLALGR